MPPPAFPSLTGIIPPPSPRNPHSISVLAIPVGSLSSLCLDQRVWGPWEHSNSHGFRVSTGTALRSLSPLWCSFIDNDSQTSFPRPASLPLPQNMLSTQAIETPIFLPTPLPSVLGSWVFPVSQLPCQLSLLPHLINSYLRLSSISPCQGSICWGVRWAEGGRTVLGRLSRIKGKLSHPVSTHPTPPQRVEVMTWKTIETKERNS